jgi:hypothetical protein
MGGIMNKKIITTLSLTIILGFGAVQSAFGDIKQKLRGLMQEKLPTEYRNETYNYLYTPIIEKILKKYKETNTDKEISFFLKSDKKGKTLFYKSLKSLTKQIDDQKLYDEQYKQEFEEVQKKFYHHCVFICINNLTIDNARRGSAKFEKEAFLNFLSFYQMRLIFTKQFRTQKYRCFRLFAKEKLGFVPWWL